MDDVNKSDLNEDQMADLAFFKVVETTKEDEIQDDVVFLRRAFSYDRAIRGDLEICNHYEGFAGFLVNITGKIILGDAQPNNVNTTLF